VKPFLKWPGNKYKIIERIKRELPSGNRLIEPFVGSGAVFLNTDYNSYILGDINQDLISLFMILKSDGQGFINYAKTFFSKDNNSEDRFYELRDLFNSTNDSYEKAAIFIYLNKHAYNGLCRYNLRGHFNAPYGRYKRPYFPEIELLEFHKKSPKAEFVCQGFHKTFEQARKGDVIYCDPPYEPLSKTSNFTSYSSSNFNRFDQEALANMARSAASRGITVVVSNHDTEYVHSAYNGAKIEQFEVQRYISCKGDERNRVGEILAIFS